MAAIHADLAAFSFRSEGHRKVVALAWWVGRNRVLRLMHENQLLSPYRHPPRPANDHAGTILTTAPDRLGGTDTSMVQTVQDGRVWVFAQATGYCCFFDREGLSVCSPDSAPCLPAAPGAPAAVLCSGLDTCFCVAALGATLVPAAGPEVSPCVGPAAMAIGAQSNNVDRIPADKRALTAIALIRCLPSSGPNTPPSRARFVLDWLFDQETSQI